MRDFMGCVRGVARRVGAWRGSGVECAEVIHGVSGLTQRVSAWRGSGVECAEGVGGVSAWCGSEGECVAWLRGWICAWLGG